MIVHCVRPGCANQFDSGAGEIYTLERRSSGTTEFFWMCPECEQDFSVSLSNSGELEVVPKRGPFDQIPPNPEADLRMFPKRFWRRVAA
jgi:hypothetical protein